MNILVILGSARKNGNSETLARTIVEPLMQHFSGEVDYVQLSKKDLSPCRACGGCEKTGLCVIRDDMGDLYTKVDSADIIFLVSPVYFYGVSAQCKIFIDRFQARWSRKYLQNIRFRRGDKRKGYLISAAATHGKKIFDASILVAKSYFDAIDVPYGGSFVVRGVDDRGEVRNHSKELQRAKEFGRAIAQDFTP